MSPIRYEQHPLGRRCFVFGKRVHHFWPGLLLAGVGAYLVWDDRRDFWDFVIR